MDHQVGSGYLDLTEAERRLVQVVGSGDQLDLAGRKYRAGDLIPADVMRRWGRSHTVRASVIRDILRGRLVGRPDPRGIRLRGARISGRLDLNYLTATIPLSLTDCLLPDGIVASSATLPALILRGSLLAHRDLPPLGAEGLVVGQDVFLDGGFTATASGSLGAVQLAGARIGGQLVCADAAITGTNGSALTTDGLVVGQDLYLARLTASGGGPAAVLELPNTTVGRMFHYGPATVANNASRGSRINVDGLTYRALPAGLTPTEWLQVIRHDTPAYAAQPYRHLAAALSAAGDERQARDVLMAQRQDQLDRGALTGASQRAWARFTGVVLGYGYRPSRALLFLLGVLAVSVILATVLGAHGALAQPRLSGSARLAAPCTPLQRVAVGLDVGEPLGVPSAQCGTTLLGAGSAFTVLHWLLEVAAWALAALF